MRRNPRRVPTSFLQNAGNPKNTQQSVSIPAGCDNYINIPCLSGWYTDLLPMLEDVEWVVPECRCSRFGHLASLPDRFALLTRLAQYFVAAPAVGERLECR